jgi:uncharacterized surface protein with fasciclin (FAS1) repeats
MKITLTISALTVTGLIALGASQAPSFASTGDGASASCSVTAAAAPNAAYRGGDDIVSTAVKTGKFNTLAAALKAAGLIEALQGDGPFTVFAPTDDAFAKLPAGTVEKLLKPENKAMLTAILTYHVVPGSVAASEVVNLATATTLNGQRLDITTNADGVMIDNARVIATDITCSNGVIHVIDSVILPKQENLLETAVSAGSFGTLAAAVEAAGLAEALSGEGPFTVFAPTDDAFAALPAGTVESLLKPENKHKLAAILKYHVVSGRIYANEALDAQSAATLQGEMVRVRLIDGQLRVNDAKVIATDIDTSNGVVHVIDRVIMPGG